MKKIFTTLVGSSVLAAGLLSLSAIEASAASLGPGNGTCSVTDVTVLGMNATSCRGYYAGNDKNQDTEDTLADQFAAGTWTQSVSSDDDPGSLPITGAGTTSGTWGTTITHNLDFALAVKAGNSFSLYYFTGKTLPLDLGDATWSTAGVEPVGSGNTPALSHLTLYTGTSGTNPIPEPLTMLGAGTALGFGTFFKKKLAQAKSDKKG